MRRFRPLLMRFESSNQEIASLNKGNVPQMKAVPESMKAKKLANNYVPYPLPKYDETFEYGPISLGGVPDIHAAKRVELGALMPRSVHAKESNDESTFNKQDNSEPSDSILSEDIEHLQKFQRLINDAISKRERDNESSRVKGGWVQCQYQKVDFGNDFENKIRDLNECTKPVSELVSLYRSVAHAKKKDTIHLLTLSDLTNTIPRQSKEELISVINVVAEQFDISSITKGRMFQRNHVSNLCDASYDSTARPDPALINAYTWFHRALERELIVEAPERLCDVDILIALYRLLARTQFRDLNSWYSVSEKKRSCASNSSPGKPASYLDFDPLRMLWDGMSDLIAGSEKVTCDEHWMKDVPKSSLVTLLSALIAASPNQKGDGPAVKRILDIYFSNLNLQNTEEIGDLCLACVVGSISDERPFMLLSQSICDGNVLSPNALRALGKTNSFDIINLLLKKCDTCLECSTSNPEIDIVLSSLRESSISSLTLSDSDFFLANKSYIISKLILSTAKTIESQHNKLLSAKKLEKDTLVALDNLRGEFFLAAADALSSLFPNKLASYISQAIGLDTKIFEYISSFGEIFYDLSNNTRADSAPVLSLPSGKGTWESIQRSAYQNLENSVSSFEETVNQAFGGMGGLRSPLQFVPTLRGLKEIVVIHSNSLITGIETLSQLVRQANESGTKGLAISTSTLVEMQKKSLVSPTKNERRVYRAGLKILAAEASRMNGSVFVLPVSEEVLLRGENSKGSLDEDQLVWLLREELSRVCPSVPVLVSVYRHSLASSPCLSGPVASSAGGTVLTHFGATRSLLAAGRFYKGGQHVRDTTEYGGYGVSMGSLQCRTILSGYKKVTDKTENVRGYYRRNLTRWMGKDGGIREKIKISPTERFGFGMLQGAMGADIRNMGLYTPDFPSFDSRCISGVDSSWSPSEDHPLSERNIKKRTK